jgi:hypothetical protein
MVTSSKPVRLYIDTNERWMMVRIREGTLGEPIGRCGGSWRGSGRLFTIKAADIYLRSVKKSAMNALRSCLSGNTKSPRTKN